MAVLEEIEDEPVAHSNDGIATSSDQSSPQLPSETTEKDFAKADESSDEEGEIVKLSPEDEVSKLAESDEVKSQGNALFAKKEYEDAIDKYKEALVICPKYLKTPVAILWSNISACYAKQEKWKETVDACTRSLKRDPRYLKPLLRRAQANERLNTWSSLSSALEDYKLAHEIAPTRETALAQTRIGPKIAEAQKKETAEMMGKLKELGNGILKPFGLSTDMFKMQPDGKGGYSMNFSKS